MKRSPTALAPAQRAFTLVELLVVVAIVGILASLLMPALGRARAGALNAACTGNLRQLGIAARGYAEDNASLLPAAELLPTQPASPTASLPRICDLLASQMGDAPPAVGTNRPPSRVFRCPADRPDRFSREGSSYEWNTELNGRRLDEPRNSQVHVVQVVARDHGDTLRFETNASLSFPPASTPLLYDYDENHPRPPRSGKNAVFMDGHVGSLDTMLE